MALPGVNIELQNGQLGSVATSNDGVAGLILTGADVAGANKVKVGNSYLLTSLEAAVNLGIDAGGTNDFAYQQIKEFYAQATKGSQLWIMLVASTVAMPDMADKTKAFAPKLLNDAKGAIRILGISKKKPATPTILEGVAKESHDTIVKLQELAVDFSANQMPFRGLVDMMAFDGTPANLKNYKTASFNRVAPVIAATNTAGNAAVGFTLGLLSTLPVQRKISRVKNGALTIAEAYMTDGKSVDEYISDLAIFHDRGYICFRTFVGKSGYYFNDDPTATAPTDDYSTISKSRVIDKAQRIAYDVFSNEVGDEIEVSDDGKLEPAQVKSIQGTIENAINLQMVANDECSAVNCFIDHNQNVLSTDKLVVILKIRPVGYKNFINVKLGFDNPALNN